MCFPLAPCVGCRFPTIRSMSRRYASTAYGNRSAAIVWTERTPRARRKAWNRSRSILTRTVVNLRKTYRYDGRRLNRPSCAPGATRTRDRRRSRRFLPWRLVGSCSLSRPGRQGPGFPIPFPIPNADSDTTLRHSGSRSGEFTVYFVLRCHTCRV